MIYDIVVEQAEPEEEVVDDKKEYGKAVTSQFTSLSDQKSKDADEVFEEWATLLIKQHQTHSLNATQLQD